MFKVDLHTHSVASPDGGISALQYHRMLEKGLLDCIAVTDHNRIDFALALHEQLGDRIIVGEEIMSSQGEIIGLFLKELIPAGLTAQETMERIRAQDGIVYIPHPFETVRKGIHPAVLESLADFADIIEVCNGRAFAQNKSAQALLWAKLNHKLGAASSDAHGVHGMGRTYTTMSEVPAKSTLLDLLAKGVLITKRPTMRALLYPKYHRLKKRRGGKVQ